MLVIGGGDKTMFIRNVLGMPSDEVQVEETEHHGYCENCQSHALIYECYLNRYDLERDVFSLCRKCLNKVRAGVFLQCMSMLDIE